MIHQAYHLLNLLKTMNTKFSELNTIVEFGGGYGCLALLIHRLGFKGKYIIIDLPEMSCLQKYYLSHHTIQSKNYQHVDFCTLSSFLEKYPHLQPDLFISNWALSESPSKTLHQLTDLLKNTKSSMVSYQETFSDINNERIYDLMKMCFKKTTRNEISFLPKNYYIFSQT